MLLQKQAENHSRTGRHIQIIQAFAGFTGPRGCERLYTREPRVIRPYTQRGKGSASAFRMLTPPSEELSDSGPPASPTDTMRANRRWARDTMRIEMT